MCDEYEYQPHGVFGSGSGSPLGHVVSRRIHRPLGLLAAARRSDDMGAKKKRSKAQGKLAAANKIAKKAGQKLKTSSVTKGKKR